MPGDLLTHTMFAYCLMNPLTMSDWIDSRDNAKNNPHPYTVILQNISQKVK